MKLNELEEYTALDARAKELGIIVTIGVYRVRKEAGEHVGKMFSKYAHDPAFQMAKDELKRLAVRVDWLTGGSTLIWPSKLQMGFNEPVANPGLRLRESDSTDLNIKEPDATAEASGRGVIGALSLTPQQASQYAVDFMPAPPLTPQQLGITKDVQCPACRVILPPETQINYRLEFNGQIQQTCMNCGKTFIILKDGTPGPMVGGNEFRVSGHQPDQLSDLIQRVMPDPNHDS